MAAPRAQTQRQSSPVLAPLTQTLDNLSSPELQTSVSQSFADATNVSNPPHATRLPRSISPTPTVICILSLPKELKLDIISYLARSKINLLILRRTHPCFRDLISPITFTSIFHRKAALDTAYDLAPYPFPAGTYLCFACRYRDAVRRDFSQPSIPMTCGAIHPTTMLWYDQRRKCLNTGRRKCAVCWENMVEAGEGYECGQCKTERGMKGNPARTLAELLEAQRPLNLHRIAGMRRGWVAGGTRGHTAGRARAFRGQGGGLNFRDPR